MPEEQAVDELLADHEEDSHAVRLLRRILREEREQTRLLRRIAYSDQAVTGRLSQQGEPSMALTVDAAGVAHYQSEDDHGDLAPTPQGNSSGITVTFESDNPAVVSGYSAGVKGADANGVDEWTASPTVVADGTFNLSAVVANVDGGELFDDDGTTPFTQPGAVSVTLAAGQATTGVVGES